MEQKRKLKLKKKKLAHDDISLSQRNETIVK